MFYLFNLPWTTEWQCTLNKYMMYGVVVVMTNSSYGKCTVKQQKIVLKKKSDGETIHMFYLLMETEKQSTLMNEQYTEQL